LKKTQENPLYSALCKQLISRIMEAESNCEPPSDIDLRLASIIHERNKLQADLLKAKEEIEELLSHYNHDVKEAYNQGKLRSTE